MADRLLTPSKITAWLDCAHFLTLRHEVEAGTLKVERARSARWRSCCSTRASSTRRQCSPRYRAEGKSVFEVPPQDKEHHESFAAWVARVGNPMADGHDVIFQMPFVHDGIRGVADFLVRTVDPETGAVSYEPVDAKLARNEAKPGHVLQLCFYAEAIHALDGRLARACPHRAGVGQGRRRSVSTTSCPYWRRLRSQLVDVMNDDVTEATVPEPCDHCEFCEFELAVRGRSGVRPIRSSMSPVSTRRTATR